MPRTGAPNGIVDEWEGVPPADAFVNGGHVGLTIPMLIVERLTRTVYGRNSSGVVVAVSGGVDAYTKVESDARYYQKSQVYTKAEADAAFLDATEADALFLTQTEGDARYYRPNTPLSATTGVFSGRIDAAAGIDIKGGTGAAGRIYQLATHGLVIYGLAGSVADFILTNKNGQSVIENPTGTQNAHVIGALAVDGVSSFAGTVTMPPEVIRGIDTGAMRLWGGNMGGGVISLEGPNAGAGDKGSVFIAAATIGAPSGFDGCLNLQTAAGTARMLRDASWTFPQGVVIAGDVLVNGASGIQANSFFSSRADIGNLATATSASPYTIQPSTRGFFICSDTNGNPQRVHGLAYFSRSAAGGPQLTVLANVGCTIALAGNLIQVTNTCGVTVYIATSAVMHF